MYFRSGIGFLFCLVQSLTILVPASTQFQTTRGGYVFSVPTFTGAEKCNLANAQTWCYQNHSKLLEIRTSGIQTWTRWFIDYAMNNKHMSEDVIRTNGKRTNSQFTWMNGNNSRVNVMGQEPGYSRSYGYIKAAQDRYQILADTPLGKRGYICEGSSFCNNGFRVYERCYQSYSGASSWYDARNGCTDGGGDLASFDFIVGDVGLDALNGSGLNPTSTYWIGLARQYWIWQDSNFDVRYSNWQDGHPYYPDNYPTSSDAFEECLCLEPNYPNYYWKWSECDCSQSYQFVCMTELTSNSTSATAGSTSNGIASTLSTSDVRRTPSLNSPYSFDLSESTLTFTRTDHASSTSINSSVSGGLTIADNSLAIGLGVGIGGGVLLIIAVVLIAVLVTMKRKGCPRKPRLPKPSSDPPDVTPESYYAIVVKNTELDDMATADAHNNPATDANSNPVIPPPTVYADLNIVTVSQSPEDRDQTRRSLVNSKQI